MKSAMADSSATALSSQSGYVSVFFQGSSTSWDKDEFENTHGTESENLEHSATTLHPPKPYVINKKHKVLTNRGHGDKHRGASTLLSSTCSEILAHHSQLVWQYLCQVQKSQLVESSIQCCTTLTSLKTHLCRLENPSVQAWLLASHECYSMWFYSRFHNIRKDRQNIIWMKRSSYWLQVITYLKVAKHTELILCCITSTYWFHLVCNLAYIT